jgi:Flp pilus assembly protein CpaB
VLLPVALAVLATVLVGIYVISYRDSVTRGAGLVKVLVASRDIPTGTPGSAVASGGYLKTQTVPRRAVVPGSVVSGAPLTSLVAANTVYQGQQITLRQFKPIAQGGIFAKFTGTQRVVSVGGDSNQLLAGTLAPGDRVDVVATPHNSSATQVILQNLLVLDLPKSNGSSGVGGGSVTAAVQLVMTDRQAETMGSAMNNEAWFLALRPTTRPEESVNAG